MIALFPLWWYIYTRGDYLNNLQRIRKSKGLSQNQLVELSGVSRSLITKYESGEKNINRAASETLYKISTVLGCSIEDLLDLPNLGNHK